MKALARRLFRGSFEYKSRKPCFTCNDNLRLSSPMLFFLWLALLSVRGGCASVSSLLSTDPLVASVLRTTVSSSTLSELESSAAGLALWRRCLSAGRVPEFDGLERGAAVWPAEPLCSALTKQLAHLHLPRTTSRHPSVMPAALAAILAAVERYDPPTPPLPLPLPPTRPLPPPPTPRQVRGGSGGWRSGGWRSCWWRSFWWGGIRHRPI